MSFEEFDQQVNDVSEKHHPTYHEDAWGKMQQLLDEHLPVTRERKRRGWILLPLLLLLLTGGYFIVNAVTKQQNASSQSNTNRIINGDKNTNPATVKATKNDASVNRFTQTGIGKEEIQTVPAIAAGDDHPVLTDNGILNNTTIRKEGSVTVTRERTAKNTGNKVNNNHKNNIASTRLRHRSAPKIVFSGNDESNADTETPPTMINTGAETTTPALPGTGEPEKTTPIENEAIKPETAPAKDVAATAKKQPVFQKRKGKHRPGNAIAITLHAGRDVSAIHFSNPGKRKTISGVGIQYQLNRHFALRSGFLKTDKVYTAQPSDYHPGTSYTPWGYKLQSIDGNCRVYEVPVSISYTFKPGNKLNFFMAAGVTSMVMKKEDYQYHYKSNSGQYKGYHYGIANKNEHLFSSADIAVGVEKKMGYRFFFKAEPYLRVPLKSVGYGNIRLKSAGILLTAGFKPFAKK
jgi:hypothetical protein